MHSSGFRWKKRKASDTQPFVLWVIRFITVVLAFVVPRNTIWQTADGKFAAAMMALELQPGSLNGKGGKVIESEAFAIM